MENSTITFSIQISELKIQHSIFNSYFWIENAKFEISIQISELKIEMLNFQFRNLNWICDLYTTNLSQNMVVCFWKALKAEAFGPEPLKAEALHWMRITTWAHRAEMQKHEPCRLERFDFWTYALQKQKDPHKAYRLEWFVDMNMGPEKNCCVDMNLTGWKDLLIWTWALKAEKNCCVNMSPLGGKDLLIWTWASKAEKEMFWEHEPLRAEMICSQITLY